jgi:5-methylcytosine-specific restriction endonuclease McrA
LSKRHARFAMQLSEAQGHRCAYCGCVLGYGPGETKPTADHYQAACHGGPKTYENCIAACGPCNSKRGHMHPVKFFNSLRANASAS